MDEFEVFLKKCVESQKSSGLITIGDVLDTMNEEQKHVLYYLIGEAVKEERALFVQKLRVFLEYYT